jgi:tetratricopeptide (TPR) repeat protein
MRSTLLRCSFLPFLFVAVLGQSATTVVPIAPPKDAAPPNQNVSNAAPDYSAESLIIERRDDVYKMSADGTGLNLTTIVAKVQSEAAAKQLGVVGVAYASSSEHVEFSYVRVRHPNGTVTETPLSDALDMPAPVTQQAPFYSDLKQKQIPVRGLQQGDTLEWQAKSIRTKAEAPGQFWGAETFSEDAVVLSQTLELRVPKNIYVNVWSPKNKPTETVEGEERVFRWVSSQKKPTVGKEADAEKERKKKEIWTAEQELDGKQGKLPSVAWSTFKSWEAVGAWYQGLESDRIVPDETVKAKAADLTAGKKSEEEKVRAIYSYVATQIRYIGVAFGIGRYQPHHAKEVLENQYGDCKDKHTLLAAMLSAEGLHPQAVLIGAGVRFNDAVPSPASFNHLITTVAVGEQQIWLDSTEEVAPYRVLNYVIRDRKALAVPDAGAAKLETTPSNLPFDSVQKVNAVGTLDKQGTSNSHLTWTFRGDGELILREALRQISPGQYGELVQRMSQSMGWAGTTSNIEASKPEDTAEPMTLGYDYKRERGTDWSDLKILAQLGPSELVQVDEKEPPVQSIQLGVPRMLISTAAMKLPDGWGAVVPDAIHTKSAYATFDESYRFEKGTLYAERRVEILKESVPASDWKTYKAWMDQWGLTQERWVQLVTDGNKAATGGGVSRKPSNAEAAKLIQSASDAINARDIDKAKADLERAKELNPDEAYLWSTYGWYHYQLGAMNTAIQEYKKELAAYPEQVSVYPFLVTAETSVNQRKEIKQTLVEWEAADSRDPRPPAALAQILLEDGDAAGAEKAAEAAIARLPEDKKKDEKILTLLGQAQLRSGMREGGRDILLPMMKDATDTGRLNDLAYELADAGEALPEDEAAVRKAIDMMTTESKTWTFDENMQTLSAKSQLLIAAWDTLGWTLYREGKQDEAEGYLKAAWVNTQQDVVAEHLGELEAAKGKKNEALTIYRMGIAVSRPGAEQKKLQARAEELQKAGFKSSTNTASSTAQESRTVPLGAAKGLNGVAEYHLLMSGGKVVRAKKSGDKELPGGEERLKEASLVGYWPAGSDANLVRTGMLNCHSNVCEIVFTPR